MENNPTDPKQALLESLRQSKNILVTVSANPSVDQLAACLGLTLWLNKAGKHATAVFSGDVPSTLEFLQPDETLEKNTDSLRDFIISLDKTKADKLRYKVEDKVVKIFITPYRTSLSADDLEYSQGDFNVDLVVAIGVNSQDDLDNAVTSHGRILHDATVATITTGEVASELGSISWHETQASSLCELVVDVGNEFSHQQLDNQIATALLTGIVAETERFSNEKTSPQTMSLSAQLMSAGANQQLVASKLGEPETAAPIGDDGAHKGKDGSLEIEHQAGEKKPQNDEPTDEAGENPESTEDSASDNDEQHQDDQPAEAAETSGENEAGNDPEGPIDDVKETAPDEEALHQMTDEPQMGGTLTANSEPDDIMSEPTSDAMSMPDQSEKEPLLDHENGNEPVDAPDAMQPAPPSWMPDQSWMSAPAVADDPTAPTDKTLAEIEASVDSPHLTQNDEPAAQDTPQEDSLDTARDEVFKALEGAPDPMPEPSQALNAQVIDLNPPQPDDVPTDLPVEPAQAPGGSTDFNRDNFAVHNDTETLAPVEPVADFAAPADPELTTPVEQPYTMPLPGAINLPPANPVAPTSVTADPNTPPVPPPFPFATADQQK